MTGSQAPSVWQGTVLVAGRELGELRRNRQVLFQFVVFGTVFPVFLALTLRPTGGAPQNFAFVVIAIAPHLGTLPAILQAFVGERAERTLAPLLATPLANQSIFLGKVLAVYLPALCVGALGLGIFATTVALSPPEQPNLPALPPGVTPESLGFPTVQPGVTAAQLGEAFALSLAVGLAVLVLGIVASTRTNTVKSAQTLAALLGLPIYAGVAFLSFRLTSSPLQVLTGALIAVPVLLLALFAVARKWRREEAILGRAGRARAG